MSHFEIIQYHSHIDTVDSYMYENEVVQIITIFTDTNLALIEDKSGNILEISVHQLEKIN
ncbi:MAG: hypothetical protein PHX13_12060 [Thiovulaceae bacterium]|nr:hypothetical protein [Sulfurimonadaceae bacterium]